jgi:LysM repeat protein
MTLPSLLTRLLPLAGVALWMSGCFPLTDAPADEQKDPHFLAGKSRLSSMDYDGAIAAFENALISNPKSAAAHFELALLYEEKKADYAAAIYHFDRHLELRPESNMAETVKQHILACKLELAKTVPFALVNRQVQDELRHLYVTNSFLHDQVEQLKAQLVDQVTAFSNRLAQALQVAAQSQPQPQTQVQTQPFRSAETDRRAPVVDKPPSSTTAHSSSRPVALPRTHVVKPGETLAGIAKRYNIKLSSLQSANRYVEARRLRAGQVLNIPAGRD